MSSTNYIAQLAAAAISKSS